jgi:N-acetylmuramoyl-L-alanine amidase
LRKSVRVRQNRAVLGQVPLSRRGHTSLPGKPLRFAILLLVRFVPRQTELAWAALLGLAALGSAIFIQDLGAHPQSTSQAPPNPAVNNPQTPPPATSSAPVRDAPSVGLNIVVLDPAHGGTDLGARGTEGIRESEVLLQFASQVKHALEAQGFQVMQTREGNENPSFDDRSARANAQRGAVFITLHIASTGLAGTARTYVMPESPQVHNATGLIPWDQAQAPFLPLSRRLGDLVQAELAKRFKGSPPAALIAPIRQLRTTAAPAIAVEISSVSVENRADLDRMIPGVADAIARGVADFRPSYVLPMMPGTAPGAQP